MPQIVEHQAQYNSSILKLSLFTAQKNCEKIIFMQHSTGFTSLTALFLTDKLTSYENSMTLDKKNANDVLTSTLTRYL